MALRERLIPDIADLNPLYQDCTNLFIDYLRTDSDTPEDVEAGFAFRSDRKQLERIFQERFQLFGQAEVSYEDCCKGAFDPEPYVRLDINRIGVKTSVVIVRNLVEKLELPLATDATKTIEFHYVGLRGYLIPRDPRRISETSRSTHYAGMAMYGYAWAPPESGSPEPLQLVSTPLPTTKIMHFPALSQ